MKRIEQRAIDLCTDLAAWEQLNPEEVAAQQHIRDLLLNTKLAAAKRARLEAAHKRQVIRLFQTAPSTEETANGDNSYEVQLRLHRIAFIT